MSLGSDIKHARKLVGKGMRSFAKLVDILPSRYCDIENGKVQPTNIEYTRIIRELEIISRLNQQLRQHGIK